MLGDLELEVHVQDLLIDICEVLHRHGIMVISVGALMRLMGVNDRRAAQHDDEFITIDEHFSELLRERKTVPESRPSGTILH